MQEKRPVGIITHKDIMSKIVQPRIPPDAVTAREIMSTPVVTISEDASIEETARIMAKKNIKKLPVVRENELVGIITSTDIVRERTKTLQNARRIAQRISLIPEITFPFALANLHLQYFYT